MEPYDYWARGYGLRDLTPDAKADPEGPWLADALHAQIAGHGEIAHAPDRVVELGCGAGRLAHLFHPASYLGLDICEPAIAIARVDNPRHIFAAIGKETALAGGDVLLAFTVLLHVPDDDLASVIARIAPDTVVVGEIMGRNYRTEGLPPVFNRELSEYRTAFSRYGFSAGQAVTFPYAHYDEARLTLARFTR